MDAERGIEVFVTRGKRISSGYLTKRVEFPFLKLLINTLLIDIWQSGSVARFEISLCSDLLFKTSESKIKAARGSEDECLLETGCFLAQKPMLRLEARKSSYANQLFYLYELKLFNKVFLA